MIAASDISPSVPFRNERELLVPTSQQTTPKIVELLQQQHKLDRTDYDKISEQFWRGNARDTAKYIFDFHKKHINYDVEPESDQTVKTPGAILYHQYGDCKHYSLFTCGICDSLARKGYPIGATYRFVADRPDLDIHHVFAIVNGPVNDYWCDPVLDSFNTRPTFYNIQDSTMSSIGAISRISGRHHGHIDLSKYFHSGEHIKSFLHHHGVRPGDFRTPEDMQEGLTRIIRHHNYSPGQMFKFGPRVGYAAPEYSPSGFAANMPMVSGIGKKKKARKKHNLLKKFAHGMSVNFQNAKKGIEQALPITLKVALIPARKAFLSLVALNVRSLATNLNRWKGKPQWNELMNTWKKKAGGNPKVLDQAIHNGAGRKRLGYLGVAGFDDATVATATALASAILAMLAKFIHAQGTAGAETKAAEAKAAKDGIKHLTSGVADASNEFDPDAGYEKLSKAGGNIKPDITPDVEPDGSPSITVHDIDPPAIPGHDHDAAGAGTTPVASSDDDDDSGDDASPATPAGGTPGSGAGVQGFIDKMKDFFFHNETLILVGTGAAIGLPLLIRSFGKKRRR